jgi:propanol-preferring alcohol dehydrogenase
MSKKTMKAGVVHEFGKPLRIEEVPIPEPGEGQVLMKVMASGVCHSFQAMKASAMWRQSAKASNV